MADKAFRGAKSGTPIKNKVTGEEGTVLGYSLEKGKAMFIVKLKGKFADWLADDCELLTTTK